MYNKAASQSALAIDAADKPKKPELNPGDKLHTWMLYGTSILILVSRDNFKNEWMNDTTHKSLFIIQATHITQVQDKFQILTLFCCFDSWQVLGPLMCFASWSLKQSTIGDLFSFSFIYSVIGLGAAAAPIALLGIVAARARSSRLCFIYAILLVCYLCAHVALVVYWGVVDGNPLNWAENGWKSSDQAERVKLQNDFTCCGYYSFNDSYAGWPCPTNLPAPPVQPPSCESSVCVCVCVVWCGVVWCVVWFGLVWFNQLLISIWTCSILDQIRCRANIRAAQGFWQVKRWWEEAGGHQVPRNWWESWWHE